ncbi:hypothetical protein CJU89_4346 [Yarrowia sp. B02]|nr:hypothetical protein CJU89_4346 [Yarrowia sp. B02]
MTEPLYENEDYGYGYGSVPNHYYVPENQFDYMSGAPPMAMHPHMGPYPMGPHPPMPQYMHQRQPSYGGARYDMAQPGMGYYVPVQPFMEPTPEPEFEHEPEKGQVKADVKAEVKTEEAKKESKDVSIDEKDPKNVSSDQKSKEASTEQKGSKESSKDKEPKEAKEAKENDKDNEEKTEIDPVKARKEQLREEKLEKQQKQKDTTITYIQELFESKNLTETALHVNSTEVPVHSIFAARSAVLAEKLKHKNALKIQISDPGNWINEAAVSAVLATLYGLPLPPQMRQAQWFGTFLVAESLGLAEVRAEIELALKKQLVTTQATITALNSVVQRCLGKGNSANSASLPGQLTKQSSELAKLFNFLVSCLGSLTQTSVADLATSSLIKSPFALYKVIMESSQLLEGNTMEKYALAKKLMQPRQKSHQGFLDVAVLAFSSDNDGLEIRRKKA